VAGNDKRTKFTLQRRAPTQQSRDDFATVFASDFADRPAMPQDILIDQIEPSPLQARQEFKNLEELAQAMREHGFTSRLRVRPHPTLPERYQLVYGERRLRAARMAGITIIPCDVAPHSDSELREIGLTENIVREDLNPLEEARAFEQALAARDDAGQPLYSIRSLAERIGKDKGYIQNRIKLLETPYDVQQMVDARPDTLRAAREISKLPTAAARAPLIQGLLSGQVNAQDVSRIVRDVALSGAEGSGHTSVSLEQRVARAMHSGRTRASASRPGNSTGSQIDHDLEQLQNIMSRLYSQVSSLSQQQRERVLAGLDQHMTSLETLLRVLK
jgi:ParB/RepB/Spo0J family partition protein